MKKLLHTFMILMLLGGFYAQGQTYSRINIPTDQNDLTGLYSLGLPLDDAVFDKNEGIVVELSQNDLDLLGQSGFTFEILIEDMSAFYRVRNHGIDPELVKTMNFPLDDTWPVPAGFDLGSIGGFCSITEMLGHLDNMIASYPSLISDRFVLDSLTIEGREIYWVKISDNPGVDEDEPEVLYTGMHHAREPIGMQHLLFFMYYLLENYDSDPVVQYVVDNFELYFVPIINMDGYAYNIQEDPNGGGMWRKTRRNNGDGTYGVDPNRNYAFEWGYDNNGSSPYTSDATYRGPYAFSEPCLQSIKNFTETHEFRVALNYHSHSNLLLYPWGYDYFTSPDNEIFQTHSQIMVAENNYENIQGVYLYPVNGSSDDWMYGEQTTKDKILSYTPEVGNSNDGFWPSVSRIIPLCQENMWQSLMAARLSGAYATVRDMSPGIIEETSGLLYFGIQRLGLEDGGNYSVSITPLNNAIESTGDPMEFDNLELLQELAGSISYTLKSDIQTGDEISYLLSVDNGAFTESDTVNKIFGTPVVVFDDDGENIEKWTSPNWDIISGIYHSPENSITDSPSGEYSNNDVNIITLVDPIDLSSAVYASLGFWARWEIETGYDYVQVLVSADEGSNWTPLSGKYTRIGNEYQAEGEPVFDGFQTDWVNEEMSLEEFLGESILLQFRIVSDNYVTEDGFYWDDMVVTIIDLATAIDEPGDENPISLVASPNPARDYVNFSYTVNNHQQEAMLLLYNSLGQVVATKILSSNQSDVQLDLSGLEAGVYYFSTKQEGSVSAQGKLIIY